jgi:hypothetical protein
MNVLRFQPRNYWFLNYIKLRSYFPFYGFYYNVKFNTKRFVKRFEINSFLNFAKKSSIY